MSSQTELQALRRPLRLAMIGFRGIPHTYGGNEEFIRHLAPRLAARGHDVTVYCRTGHFDDRAAEWRGVKRVFYPTFEHKSIGQFVHALFAAVDSTVHQFDAVYIHTLPSAPFSVLPRIFGKRVIVNVNGMEWGRDKWGPIGKAYFRAAARISANVATTIVNDSEAMQRFYLDRFGRDSYFIAYGADIQRSENPDVVRQFGVEPNGYYLIASRLVPENNPDLIIDAYKKSGASRPLLVAGTANYDNDWVRSLMAKADENVRFIGHVADPEHVRELHCNCYAYVHGHSLGGTNPSLLKALGYGNCILALDNPFNREVMVNKSGKAFGLLFPHNVDSLAGLIREIDPNPERAAAFRSVAPDRIREAYTWESITDKYERMFLESTASQTSAWA